MSQSDAFSRAGRKAARKGRRREREFAKLLSLWWTGGKNKYAFRRTPLSGGFPKKRSHGDILPASQDASLFPFVVEIKDRKNFKDLEFVDLLVNKKSLIFRWWEDLRVIIQSNPMFLSDKHPLLVLYKRRRYYCIMGKRGMSFLEDRVGKIPYVKVRHSFGHEILYVFSLDYLIREKYPEALRIPPTVNHSTPKGGVFKEESASELAIRVQDAASLHA